MQSNAKSSSAVWLYYARAVGARGAPPPQFLTYQVTPKGGGQIMPTTLEHAPQSDFHAFLRPC